MANKNSSEPDNRSNRSRPTAPAASSSERRAAATSDSLSRSLSNGGDATSKATAADMRGAGAMEDDRDPGHDEIAEAAYHRFLRRGGQDGGDFDDWVQAERDLRERRSR